MAAPQENETDKPFSIDDPEENVEKLVVHEDVFLERKKQIRGAIVSTIESGDTYNSSSRIFNNMEIAVSGSSATSEYDEEEWDDLGTAIVGFIHMLMVRDAGMLDLIEEEGASQELQDFIIDLMIECGEDLQRLNFYQSQGKNWWSFIRTERVAEDNVIKHRHMITIDREKEIEIDSSPYSDWMLAAHFMREILEAYSREDVQLDSILDPNQFNQIRANVYAFEEAIKDSNLEIELPDRGSLLGSGSEEEPVDE